jgi:FtsH-binding integral membrane protein
MFNEKVISTSGRAETQVDPGLRAHMIRVYNTMFVGLLLTALVAYFTSQSEAAVMFVANNGLIFGLGILGMAIGFSFLVNRLSHAGLQLYFYGFAALFGAMTSVFLLYYTGESVARAFVMTAALFGGLSLYGYTTKRDLTSMGTFLHVGLWVLIIGSLINAFIFKSTAGSMAISAVSLIIFTGLTAYDTQKIKNLYYSGVGHEGLQKLSVVGALTLYLDFINMFLAMLRLFGTARN